MGILQAPKQSEYSFGAYSFSFNQGFVRDPKSVGSYKPELKPLQKEASGEAPNYPLASFEHCRHRKPDILAHI